MTIIPVGMTLVTLLRGGVATNYALVGVKFIFLGFVEIE